MKMGNYVSQEDVFEDNDLRRNGWLSVRSLITRDVAL